jgi:UDP-N-acetylglucosamine 2-epimerase
LRNSMERPEAQDAGTIFLTGFDPDVVLKSIELSMIQEKDSNVVSIPYEYRIADTSKRVLNLMVSTCKLSNKWDNIISFDDKI